MLSSTFKKSYMIPKYFFAGGGNVKTPNNLEEYDLISVGGNLGSIANKYVTNYYLDKRLQTMYVEDENIQQLYQKRVSVELYRMAKRNYLLMSSKIRDTQQAWSEFSPVVKYLPEESAIVLKNGKKIKYKQLIIATGYKKNPESIKNLRESLRDPNIPVFSNYELPENSQNDKKTMQYITQEHRAGDSYFYIPPFPVSSTVESYNFLLTQDYNDFGVARGWKTPLQKIKILNANDKFVENNEEADKFIKEKCKEKGIEVIYNYKLTEIDNENKKLFVLNSSGQQEKLNFIRLYCMWPSVKDQQLIDDGLANKQSNDLLDINPETLQHNKYKNIWGLGDCANLPIHKNTIAGLHQVNVLRHNVAKALKNQEIDGKYDGTSVAPLMLATNRLTFLHRNYKEYSPYQLKYSSNSIMDKFVSWVRFLLYTKDNMHQAMLIKAILCEGKLPPFYYYNKLIGDDPYIDTPKKVLDLQKKFNKYMNKDNKEETKQNQIQIKTETLPKEQKVEQEKILQSKPVA